MVKNGVFYIFKTGDEVDFSDDDGNHKGSYTFKKTHILTIEHGLIYIGNKYYEILDVDVEYPVEIKLESLDNRPGMLEINEDEIRR